MRIGVSAARRFAERPSYSYPRLDRWVPPGELGAGRYRARFAVGEQDLEAVQRLRFDVLNLEFECGLPESFETGLDADGFDEQCHHLLVEDRASGEVVATYRLCTRELAEPARMATAGQFVLGRLPEPVLDHGVEISRACLAVDHRNPEMLLLLWKGLARYADWNDKRFLFGCAGLARVDATTVSSVCLQLSRRGQLHRRIRVPARERPLLTYAGPSELQTDIRLPGLFDCVLRLGGKVVSGPAVDHSAGVSEFLVLLDLRTVTAANRRALGGPGEWRIA